MKKEVSKEKNLNNSFNNRILYTFILFGILMVLSGGIYAIDTSLGWHSGSQIDFTGGFNVPSGNVGIGTTSPTGKLTIYQDNSAPNNGGSNIGALDLTHPTSGGISMITFKSTVNWPTDGGYIAYFDDNNNYNYWGDSNENSALVIGVTNDGKASNSDVVALKSPAAVIVDSPSLIVSGDVTANAFLYSSDKSLKENILPLTNSLNKIQQLQGVSFNWKENGKKGIGLIAQDVEKVFPELVHTNNEGLKSIEYGNLVAVLIEAIKEQQKEIDNLQKQIDELKAKER